MLISVIIPVYNVERYLPQCLDSILAQTYQVFEVICINDGSTDDSLQVLEEYAAKDSRIKVVSQTNAGLSAARNAGLSVASGDYVFFLDSDDWIEQNALEILASSIVGQDMICFNGRRYLEETGEFENADELTTEQIISGWEYYNKYSLQPRNFAFVCVVLRLYSREFLLKNNLKFAEGIYHEDNRFTPLACYYAQKVSVINDVLYNYRVRPSSITTTVNVKRQKDLILTANFLSKFFVSKQIPDKNVIYRALTHHYQSAFLKSDRNTDRELVKLVDWKLYYTVARTKLRHRLQFAAMRLSPSLFRLLIKI
ncbi:MAG: glycosyltransferase [Bacteroidales bacterium]|nr:glycosyltransferase [Candidatus Cryptobacteroides choladohippi]